MPVRRLDLGYVGPDDGTTTETVGALRELNFRVDVGHTVGDAEAFAEERAIDCLVVDHRESFDAIPVLEAVTAIDEILPVVVYVADGSDTLAARCIALDVDGYVRQSEETSALVDTLGDITLVDGPRRDAEGMLESLTGMAPVSLSIYFKDREGRHVNVSDNFPGLIGTPYMETPDGKILHTPEDVIGMSDFDIYGPELAVETRQDEQEIMETGEPVINKLEPAEVADEEREHYVSTTKAPWHDSTGRLRGIVGITIDVTERERNRRALSLQNDRLERFASVLSHDLRNPLGIAKGRLSELEGPPDAREDVAWALDRMDELITDVLELARQGSVIDDPEPVPLGIPAQEAWETVDGGDTLELVDLPTVEGDRERLRALFENLFRNAVQHGSTDVNVVIEDHPDGVTITDDGPGIPDEEIDEVFEQGYTTHEDGTGFGLSIVREIVQAHGWEICAVEHESGARFLIEMH